MEAPVLASPGSARDHEGFGSPEASSLGPGSGPLSQVALGEPVLQG